MMPCPTDSASPSPPSLPSMGRGARAPRAAALSGGTGSMPHALRCFLHIIAALCLSAHWLCDLPLMLCCVLFSCVAVGVATSSCDWEVVLFLFRLSNFPHHILLSQRNFFQSIASSFVVCSSIAKSYNSLFIAVTLLFCCNFKF